MKIYSPNKQYNGVSASVTFVNGQGETDNPHLIKWFKEHGYKVGTDNATTTKKENKAASPMKPEEVDVTDFSSMDEDMLRAYAEENDIDIGKATTRDGILLKIKEASQK